MGNIQTLHLADCHRITESSKVTACESYCLRSGVVTKTKKSKLDAFQAVTLAALLS